MHPRSTEEVQCLLAGGTVILPQLTNSRNNRPCCSSAPRQTPPQSRRVGFQLGNLALPLRDRTVSRLLSLIILLPLPLNYRFVCTSAQKLQSFCCKRAQQHTGLSTSSLSWFLTSQRDPFKCKLPGQSSRGKKTGKLRLQSTLTKINLQVGSSFHLPLERTTPRLPVQTRICLIDILPCFYDHWRV